MTLLLQIKVSRAVSPFGIFHRCSAANVNYWSVKRIEGNRRYHLVHSKRERALITIAIYVCMRTVRPAGKCTDSVYSLVLLFFFLLFLLFSLSIALSHGVGLPSVLFPFLPPSSSRFFVSSRLTFSRLDSSLLRKFYSSESKRAVDGRYLLISTLCHRDRSYVSYEFRKSATFADATRREGAEQKRARLRESLKLNVRTIPAFL